MDWPRTCVIIVNYKGAKDTIACIASLQNSKHPVFIVVVDNTPNDYELDGPLIHYSHVKIIRAPKNLGFGKGNNLGIDWVLDNTSCEYIFLLNNDTTIVEDTINRLINILEKNCDIGIVSPKILVKDEPDKLWYGGGDLRWYRGGAVTPGINGPSSKKSVNKSRAVTFASGCAMLIRRKVLEQVGGFDERFFMYEEDANFCRRVHKARWLIWYEPLSLVYHARQGSVIQSNEAYLPPLHPNNPNLSFYLYHINRNKILNILDQTKGLEKLAFLSGWFIWVVRNTFRYVVHGETWAIKKTFDAIVEGVLASKKSKI